MFSNHFTTNFSRNAAVKKFRNSVNNWQRYGGNLLAYFFGATLYMRSTPSERRRHSQRATNRPENERRYKQVTHRQWIFHCYRGPTLFACLVGTIRFESIWIGKWPKSSLDDMYFSLRTESAISRSVTRRQRQRQLGFLSGLGPGLPQWLMLSLRCFTGCSSLQLNSLSAQGASVINDAKIY